jgi:hypothetical protein
MCTSAFDWATGPETFPGRTESFCSKHDRLPKGFCSHRNRPEACPGQPGSSQQGLKNPATRIQPVSGLFVLRRNCNKQALQALMLVAGSKQYTSTSHAGLHYITLHYITLHYITLHYITLHYITSTDRHVLAIMQADHCRAHPHNQEVMSLYLLKA